MPIFCGPRAGGVGEEATKGGPQSTWISIYVRHTPDSSSLRDSCPIHSKSGDLCWDLLLSITFEKEYLEREWPQPPPQKKKPHLAATNTILAQLSQELPTCCTLPEDLQSLACFWSCSGIFLHTLKSSGNLGFLS